MRGLLCNFLLDENMIRMMDIVDIFSSNCTLSVSQTLVQHRIHRGVIPPLMRPAFNGRKHEQINYSL